MNKRSRWQLFKNRIRDFCVSPRKMVFYNQPLDLAFYLQTLEDTSGKYLRRLHYAGQLDTITSNKYFPEFKNK